MENKCKNCLHKKEQTGYCLTWRTMVNASDTCDLFSAKPSIEDLKKQFPNDAELGRQIRKTSFQDSIQSVKK